MKHKMEYTNIRPTGSRLGEWRECLGSMPNSRNGYFWQRSDGLCLGYRNAGNYYRDDIVLEVPPPQIEIGRPRLRTEESANIIVQAERRAKEIELQRSQMTYYPDHIRYFIGARTLEILTSLEGRSVVEINRHDEEELFFEYADRKWPRGSSLPPLRMER